MEKVHSHTPFVAQLNASRVGNINPSDLPKDLTKAVRQNQASGTNVNSNNNNQTPANNQFRLFTLNPEQSHQINNLQASQRNSTHQARSNNSSIFQYQQTENIPVRNELESLLQLDIFV